MRALLPLLLILLFACAEPRPQPPRHLFFITVDTLRADHLGLYGYPRATSPNLDRLGSEGVVFDRAIAQWPKTGPSFASKFTGQYPQTTGLTHKAALRVPEGNVTLPELLAKEGFRGLAVVSNGVLGQRLGWNRGFEEYLETWKLAAEQSDDPREYRKWLNARKVNELALPLLKRHRDASRLFVWLHYSDPHAPPYILPYDVENPFLGDPWDTGDEVVSLPEPRARAIGDRRELRYYTAQYDANVLFADRHVGEILDHAHDLGLLADALVVFTSDHGESSGRARLPPEPRSHALQRRRPCAAPLLALRGGRRRPADR